MTSEQRHIKSFLRTHGWGGDGPMMVRPDCEWRVILESDGGWRLERFLDVNADAPCGPLRPAQYLLDSQGQTLEGTDEFRETAISVGAVEWDCPNCGATGGESVTRRSREFQGCAEHGGMVEFEEEMCTRCVRQAVYA